MEKCFDKVSKKLNGYLIVYMDDERLINDMEEEFMKKGICYVKNQVAEKLYLKLPVLKKIVHETREKYGMFLAVICKK